MEIRVRDALLDDVQFLLRCGWPSVVIGALTHYRRSYFDEDGKHKTVHTGFPEEVLVAETAGRIVGYIHFFIDCYDGYEHRQIGLSVDPSLEENSRREVREKIEEEFRLYET